MGWKGLSWLAVISFSETTTLIEERLARVLFGAQLPLALLWCIVIPPAIIAKGQRIFPSGSVFLVITILSAAASSCAALFCRWKNQRRLFSTTWTNHLVPWAIAPSALVFLAVVATTRYVSLGSLLGAIGVPVVALVLGYPVRSVIAAFCVALIIVLRHRENIERLLSGTENRLGRRATAS